MKHAHYTQNMDLFDADTPRPFEFPECDRSGPSGTIVSTPTQTIITALCNTAVINDGASKNQVRASGDSCTIDFVPLSSDITIITTCRDLKVTFTNPASVIVRAANATHIQCSAQTNTLRSLEIDAPNCRKLSDVFCDSARLNVSVDIIVATVHKQLIVNAPRRLFVKSLCPESTPTLKAARKRFEFLKLPASAYNQSISADLLIITADESCADLIVGGSGISVDVPVSTRNITIRSAQDLSLRLSSDVSVTLPCDLKNLCIRGPIGALRNIKWIGDRASIAIKSSTIDVTGTEAGVIDATLLNAQCVHCYNDGAMYTNTAMGYFVNTQLFSTMEVTLGPHVQEAWLAGRYANVIVTAAAMDKLTLNTDAAVARLSNNDGRLCMIKTLQFSHRVTPPTISGINTQSLLVVDAQECDICPIANSLNVQTLTVNKLTPLKTLSNMPTVQTLNMHTNGTTIDQAFIDLPNLQYLDVTALTADTLNIAPCVALRSLRLSMCRFGKLTVGPLDDLHITVHWTLVQDISGFAAATINTEKSNDKITDETSVLARIVEAQRVRCVDSAISSAAVLQQIHPGLIVVGHWITDNAADLYHD